MKVNFKYGIAKVNELFDKVISAFNATTGHKHTGDTDDAPQIDTSGIKDGAVTKAKLGDDIVGEDDKILDENLSGETIPKILESEIDNLKTRNYCGKVYHVYAESPFETDYLLLTQYIEVFDRVFQIRFTINTLSIFLEYRVYDSFGSSWGSWTKYSEAVNTTKTATSSGTAGQTAYDTNYFYVCTATNTWIRFAKTAW